MAAAQRSLSETDGIDPKLANLVNEVESSRTALTELIAEGEELALNPKIETERPKKEITAQSTIGKAMQRALHKLDDICTITGDASLKLQFEKFKVELRLAKPDRKGMERFGDLVLKAVISVARFISDAAVKIKAYVDNTKYESGLPGYRDEVNAGIRESIRSRLPRGSRR